MYGKVCIFTSEISDLSSECIVVCIFTSEILDRSSKCIVKSVYLPRRSRTGPPSVLLSLYIYLADLGPVLRVYCKVCIFTSEISDLSSESSEPRLGEATGSRCGEEIVFTVYSIHCVYCARYTMCILCKAHSVNTVYSIQRVYGVHCTVYSVYAGYSVYSAHPNVCSLCTMYGV